MDLLGKKVGNLRIDDRLGAGGMGEVFSAFDETLERKVALKAIRPERRLDESSRARFLREARILSQLDHPNICRIHDYVQDTALGVDFLVLELIEGRSLAQAIEDGLEPRRRMEIARRVAGVLVKAHAAGVVHRDLKPTNVMLAHDGQVKVLDFGLARTIDAAGDGPRSAVPPIEVEPAPIGHEDETRLMETVTHGTERATGVGTRLGAILGTPGFMSPEQARGEPVTAASDMYAFGLVLQHLFTGHPPFTRDSSGALLLEQARRGQTLEVEGLDSDLTRLIRRLKSAAPTDRPTAVDTLERLNWILDKPRRRLRWLAACATLLVVAAAGLKYTVDLRRERAEALRLRGEADELIGFMIGDLREKLDAIGRLDVLNDVGDRSLAYFQSLPLNTLTPRERFRVAKARSLIGEVRLGQNDLESAMTAFEESKTTLESLVEREPDNPEWQQALGAAHFWVGSALLYRGDVDPAEERMLEYLRISEELSDRDPDNADWKLEVSYAHTNLAAIADRRGDRDSAIRELSQAIGIGRELVRGDPNHEEWQRGLASSLSWLGSSLQASGDLVGALERFREELAIWQGLHERDARDTEIQEMLSICHNHLADLLRLTGDDDAAIEHFREDLRISRRLVEHDPGNALWRSGLAATRIDLGGLLIRRGQLDEADGLLRKGSVLTGELAEEDPDNRDWQHMVSGAHSASARLRLAQGSPTDALGEVDRALEIERGLHAADPEDPKTRGRYGAALVTRGAVLDRLGRTDEAWAEWNRAHAVVEPLVAESDNPSVLDTWARVLLHLERLDEARRVVATLGASQYRDADFERFCRSKGV